MDFEHLIETINYELVLEGLGCMFGFGLLWNLFFHSSLHTLLSLFIQSIC